MPFLIEVKDKIRGWSPRDSTDTQERAESLAASYCKAKKEGRLRITRMSWEQIDYRRAKFNADCMFRSYLKLNAKAYNLKIKIRPAHWPTELK